MATSTQPTVEAVTERLDRVNDPELDESIVDLEYITDLEIDGSEVAVTLVLPTAWCSPAFVWMMATGARDEIKDLPSVTSTTIRLEDHMHQDGINKGVNERLAFEDVFEDAEDDIEAVRRTLAEKVRMGRQYHAIRALREAGLDDEQVVALTRDAIDLDADTAAVYLADDAFAVEVPAEPVAEYLEKAIEVGIVTGPTDRVFATADEKVIKAGDLDRLQHRSRLTGSAVTGQGTICEGLNEARNGVVAENTD